MVRTSRCQRDNTGSSPVADSNLDGANMQEVVCKIHGKVKGQGNGIGKALRCSVCNIERSSKRAKNLKERVLTYKGGKCILCGYNKCPAALDLHHVYAENKEFSMKACSTASFESIKNEIDKCVLLCANCHRELHYGEHTVHMSDIEINAGMA